MKIPISMIAIILIGPLFSVEVFAHSGEDPNREMRKSLTQIKDHQSAFESEKDIQRRRKNLVAQVATLRSRLLILRNELVTDGAAQCFKKQTEIDYVKELERTLKSSNRTLKQLKSLLDSVK